MTKVVDLCNKHLFFCLPLCSVQLDKSWFRFFFGLSVWPKLSTTLIFRFMTLSLNPNGIFFILYFNMSEQIIHHDGRYIHKSFTDFNHIISTFQFISFNTLIFLSLSCFHMSFPYPPHLISTMMISHVVDPHHLSLSLSSLLKYSMQYNMYGTSDHIFRQLQMHDKELYQCYICF